ncbi:heme/hemin ABC transporter substrate-binding protein [Rhodobaculum claviforme]|uniref:Hemin ABC transporter substrate-binding protein n=1 Tax=Rhodobaculum claviforme TaxID=1549854 RepID=A0A934TI49_9RHOB|nr:ABC transporter substrate-binding protein [Rhodobaculum claviforme]MBK5925986.1 hemin ABC transporter substrate-binding protein [Rhodobaculum claviforme]
MIRAALVLALLATPAAAAERVVSLGGAITEIVVALGQGDRLVARDATSTWPETVTALPDVGYMRALSAEGVLSVAPDLILAAEGAGPAEAVSMLRAARVPYVEVPEATDGAGVLHRISAVAGALGVAERGAALAEAVAADLARLEGLRAEVARPARVLFVLSMQGGRLMASGTGTAADGIIRMAGGANVITDFAGYRLLSDEAVLAAAPDVVLMMDRGDGHAVAADDLFAHPALVATAAGRDRRLVRMDGLLLLGFGPRTAQAALALHRALYPLAPAEG